VQIEQTPSPNHAPRGLHKVRALVMHATVGEWGSALGWMCNPKTKVSAHYLVGRDGRIAQLVPESQTARHAGVSQWRGLEVWSTVKGVRRPSLNLVSVGIELVNRNDGRDPYSPAQVAAAIELARAIIARHGIEKANLVRHADISPGRKTDPRGLNWMDFVERVYS